MNQESLIIASQRKRARPSKWGRDKVKCQRYAAQGRREKNKKKKLRKILKMQPNNVQVRSLLAE